MARKGKVWRAQRNRHIFQGLWTLVSNSYLIGFVRGKIYQGDMKVVCVPGLNCYSCPGAVASCPIGSLQAVIGSHQYQFSFYLVGFMILIGTLMGRFVCGYLCPFGLAQDLLHKIPLPEKWRRGRVRGDRALRKLKYAILAVFVVLLPLLLVDIIGQGIPYFCKLLCPAGTLEGGIPLVLLNETLRSTLGFLYTWKVALLIATAVVAMMVYRPFCKYICPLGAAYSLFNPVSAFKYRVNREKCTSCGDCGRVCDMGCDPVRNANSLECIRCGKCKAACPSKAIEYSYFNHVKECKGEVTS